MGQSEADYRIRFKYIRLRNENLCIVFPCHGCLIPGPASTIVPREGWWIYNGNGNIVATFFDLQIRVELWDLICRVILFDPIHQTVTHAEASVD